MAFSNQHTPDEAIQLRTFRFQDDGLLPNNPSLPVLLYPGAFRDKPEQAEKRLNSNGWLNSWQDGVFGYHHYHSNAHEALAVVSGSATLQLGGDDGQSVPVSAGDVLVLPAGTAHKRLVSSPGFSVVGAYPGGTAYNTRRATLADREEALAQISLVPLPGQDPVFGGDGPLFRHWPQIK